MPLNCTLPAPLFAVVSSVIVPTVVETRPCSRNTVLRYESDAADWVGVGDGVGEATGVGVGVGDGEFETDPQPMDKVKNVRSKNEAAVRNIWGLLDLCSEGERTN